MELEEYTQYQETKLHEKPGFAYETYLCTIPLDFDRVNLHWHDQMEVIYIKKGRGTVSVNLESYPVEAGCIVPVLPGELHAIDGVPDGPMEYENIIFSLSILDSTETDDWCRHHVIQALRQGTLLFDRPIRPGTAFHDAAAAALDAADRACEARPQGFALVVKSQLFMFLHALYCNRHTGPVRPLVEEAEWLKGVIRGSGVGLQPQSLHAHLPPGGGADLRGLPHRLPALGGGVLSEGDPGRDRRGGGELRLCQPVLFHTLLQSEVRRVPRTVPQAESAGGE